MNRSRKGDRWLILPTEFEKQRLVDANPTIDSWNIAVCGFGPIASAARTMQLAMQHQPAEFILAGIAGTYDAEQFPVGTSQSFSHIQLDGIGAGDGGERLSCRDLGFAQWRDELGGEIFDQISLHGKPNNSDAALLTVCAASANIAQADERRQRFPHACAEDMEAFGVALACQLAEIPLTVIRGSSNLAGDREKGNWRIDQAMQAVGRELVNLE